MLRTKLFKGFVLIVIIFSALSAYLGIATIKRRVIDEAQTRVRLDLSSAWAIYDSKLHEIETVLRLAASKEAVISMCETGSWSDADMRSRLERIRTGFGLDFLDVITPDGRVVMRTSVPYATGDFRIADPAVASALRGDALTCMGIMSGAELKLEADGLSEKAFLELEDTPHARRTATVEETRGMVMSGAVPVRQGLRVLGVIYGGVLMNRNYQLVDRIQDVVFKGEKYNSAPVGTATLFLNDIRIATTVRRENGNRALGTRVSKDVADRVLDNGAPWIGEAFVVRDWYLTAYDPIRDGRGEIVGMLYVGILKKPFEDIGRAVMLRYLWVSLFVLVVALVLAFIIAGRLAMPIHLLVEASNRMRHGEKAEPVPLDGATCHETALLVKAFNEMAQTLAEREERLKALNRSYMETLGFVSHELKSPVATIMNYVFLLREGKLGEISERQAKALKAIDVGGHRLVEMVRHYLNLSRIENGELHPVPTKVAVLDDVLKPLLETVDPELKENAMHVTNAVGPDVLLSADINMVRKVFENLVSNAIKYGRSGGALEFRAKADGEFVEFAVRNEGAGIPAERLGCLFQKFSRLGSLDGVHRKGTGLGLFITKHIVEAHGGRIGVSSVVGQWTEFTVSLPRHAGERGV